MEISTFLLIALGIFYLFYLYLINFCNNQAHENFSSSKNQSIIVYQQMCLDLHLKKPFDLVIYILNFTSTNRNKILITMGIIMAAYGWSMHATTMKQAAIDLYTEIKITVTLLLREIWTSAQLAVLNVWQTLSVLKMLQFVFLLLLMLSAQVERYSPYTDRISAVISGAEIRTVK